MHSDPQWPHLLSISSIASSKTINLIWYCGDFPILRIEHLSGSQSGYKSSELSLASLSVDNASIGRNSDCPVADSSLVLLFHFNFCCCLLCFLLCSYSMFLDSEGFSLNVVYSCIAYSFSCINR